MQKVRKFVLEQLKKEIKNGTLSGGIIYNDNEITDEDIYTKFLESKSSTESIFDKSGKVKSHYRKTILGMQNGKKYYGEIMNFSAPPEYERYPNIKLEKMLIILKELHTFQFFEKNKYFILCLDEEEQLHLEELKKKCI